MRTLISTDGPRRRLDLAAFGRALAALRGGSTAPTEPVYAPPLTGPVHRWYLRRPPDVRLETGAYCPLCDHVLDLVRPGGGWRCMAGSCWAVWNSQGRHGAWFGHAPVSTKDIEPAAAEPVADAGDVFAGLVNQRAPHVDGLTCGWCGVPATEAHTASDAHWQALLDAAGAELVDELAERVCLVTPAGAVSCGRPQPCPDHHEAVDVDLVLVDEQPHATRLDRRCALVTAVLAAATVGLVTGRAAAPAVDVSGWVAWPIFAGLLAAAAAWLSGVELVRWWRGWWPYQGNRILGDAAELGWDAGGSPVGGERDA